MSRRPIAFELDRILDELMDEVERLLEALDVPEPEDEGVPGHLAPEDEALRSQRERVGRKLAELRREVLAEQTRRAR